MIAMCTCNHAYQDQRYGKGMRVFNKGTKDSSTCSVCGNKRSLGGGTVTAKAKPAKKG